MSGYYNIHDIFSLRMDGAPADTADYILRELESFKTAEAEKADLKVIFTDRITPPDSSVSLLKDLYYKDGVMYIAFPKGSLSIPIKDLSGRAMTIISEKTTPAMIIFQVIEKIMYFKLLDKGYSFLHAACYNDGRETILYSALPGTGKTSWLLDNCSRGASFLADDLCIIDRKGNVLAYPRAFTLGKYHRRFFNIYLRNIGLMRRLRYRLIKCGLSVFSLAASPWPKLKSRIERYSISKDYFRIRIKDVIPGLKITKQARLDKIMLALKTGGAAAAADDWDGKRIADFLIYNTKRELSKFIYLHFIAFLAYGDGHSAKVKKYFSDSFLKQEDIIASLVNNRRTEIYHHGR